MSRLKNKNYDDSKTIGTTIVDTIEHPVTRDYVRLMYSRLTQFSEACACTSAKMSAMLNKSPGYFSKIESRKAFPSMETFLDFCTVCKVHPAEFFSEKFDYSYPARATADKLNLLTEKQLHLVTELVDQLLEANGIEPEDAKNIPARREAAATTEESFCHFKAQK